MLKTLVEAIIFVMLVMFLFLQDWRSTLIPAVTIPVSLVGTFAFISLLNFSINTLTLFGIVLATGLVVDDAIVVIENIKRHMGEEHSDSHVAASEAMGEVTGAVVATSLVLVAVFVPVAFFPGNHRPALQTVLADDCLLHRDLRLQLADLHAIALCTTPACREGEKERLLPRASST